MYYLPRLVSYRRRDILHINLNLLWVSSHHISPSTKEVEYEYIERIVHLRRQDMTDDAISLVNRYSTNKSTFTTRQSSG